MFEKINASVEPGKAGERIGQKKRFPTKRMAPKKAGLTKIKSFAKKKFLQ